MLTKLGAGSSRERVIFEQRLKLGFTVSPEFMNKFNKIKSLLSNKHPEGLDFETVFNIIMNEYLDRHDPVNRRERRSRRAAKESQERRKKQRINRVTERDKRSRKSDNKRREPIAKPAARRDKSAGASLKKQTKNSRNDSRRIPQAVRDRVYARDKGRCTFIGANGKRCNSTWDLEIDHLVPFARGGDNSPGNLRLLCRRHNIYQAERAYGKEFMKNYKF